MGAVHQFDDFAVDAARHHAELPPDFLALQRGVLDEDELAFLLAELPLADFGDVQGNLVIAPVADVHAQVEGQLEKLLLVLDFKVLGLAFGHELEGFDDTAAVVAVGGGPGGNHTDEVAGGDGLRRGAADAHALGMLFRGLVLALAQGYPAGAHGAVLAATAVSADGAGFHVLGAVKDRGNPFLGGLGQHLESRLVDTFFLFCLFFFCHVFLPLLLGGQVRNHFTGQFNCFRVSHD